AGRLVHRLGQLQLRVPPARSARGRGQAGFLRRPRATGAARERDLALPRARASAAGLRRNLWPDAPPFRALPSRSRDPNLSSARAPLSDGLASRPRTGWAVFLWVAPLAAAACFILIYVVVALLRVRYPYHLEWMEGGAFSQVRWILSGHPLYVRPRLLFIPFTYT